MGYCITHKACLRETAPNPPESFFSPDLHRDTLLNDAQTLPGVHHINHRSPSTCLFSRRQFLDIGRFSSRMHDDVVRMCADAGDMMELSSPLPELEVWYPRIVRTQGRRSDLVSYVLSSRRPRNRKDERGPDPAPERGYKFGSTYANVKYRANRPLVYRQHTSRLKT